jgi:RNA polymerase sigma factor (sigma-70 family)
MDRYAFILEKLKENDCGRLRRYVADGRAEFHTWLAVVTRRLCEDYRRQRYGRPQSQTAEGEARAREQFKIRHLLADLPGTDHDWSRLPSSGADPEGRLQETELYDALAEAVNGLEPQDLLLIRLRFEYDLTAKQIARLMGFPTPFHVYRRLRSRLGVLRAALREQGVRDAAPEGEGDADNRPARIRFEKGEEKGKLGGHG